MTISSSFALGLGTLCRHQCEVCRHQCEVYTALVIDSVDTPIDGSSVSTQSLVVSTLDLVSRRPSCLTGTVCRHSQWQCRH
ncbi:hypothetical protein Taro_023588 [Colocasia esculenta]|uniref:Uncharacterized protein n=1 Tax=Colocasia esculenta TaxID=4460 RepID=A0A843V8S2_COLES|nr:hypothetical protein [Colocasia esculenta]